MLFTVRTLFCLFLLSCQIDTSNTMKKNELPTVAAVDINKYAGTWYEIAKFPNSFEKGLTCITATYSLRADGKIGVLNKGHKISDPGKIQESKGKAWIPDPAYPARLKVQFFWPFAGNYYIMDLDADYEYALVGDPSRNYLWILCRTKQMDEAIYGRLTAKAKSLGFDISRIELTPQDCH